MKMLQTAMGVVFVVAITLTIVPAPSHAKKSRILLKVPVCFATSLPVVGDSALWLADNLKTPVTAAS